MKIKSWETGTVTIVKENYILEDREDKSGG